MNTSRRAFILKTGATLGGLALIKNTGMARLTGIGPYGFQSWTLREQINSAPEKTCRNMAELGYTEIEMCSPLGYEQAGFAPLGKYSGTELKRLFNDQGLSCTSSHFTFSELKESLEDRIEWAHQLGMRQMILSSFWLPEDQQTIGNYRRAADALNKIGEVTKAAGLQMGFHNHHMEFEKRDGKLIYDAILDELDGDLVKMQFQVAVVNIGYNAADYFRKYPGRFISAHLSDWTGETEVPLGMGEVDWADFFRAAQTGGLKNVYVEMAPETFRESAKYLASLP